MDAGISLWKDGRGQISGWSFAFPLGKYENKRNEGHVKPFQPIYSIGKVTKGMGCIEMLSWTLKSQRSGYTFYLESQNDHN